MTLLDYAINSSLVISKIALIKQDKAGIITFGHQFGNILPVSRSYTQMQNIQEVLYNQRTSFGESDFGTLYKNIRPKIKQRSLLLVFTNFNTLSGMEIQLPYLRQLAFHHMVLLVFFENSELQSLIQNPA